MTSTPKINTFTLVSEEATVEKQLLLHIPYRHALMCSWYDEGERGRSISYFSCLENSMTYSRILLDNLGWSKARNKNVGVRSDDMTTDKIENCFHIESIDTSDDKWKVTAAQAGTGEKINFHISKADGEILDKVRLAASKISTHQNDGTAAIKHHKDLLPVANSLITQMLDWLVYKPNGVDLRKAIKQWAMGRGITPPSSVLSEEAWQDRYYPTTN